VHWDKIKVYKFTSVCTLFTIKTILVNIKTLDKKGPFFLYSSIKYHFMLIVSSNYICANFINFASIKAVVELQVLEKEKIKQ
jgi:hypothetical protein